MARPRQSAGFRPASWRTPLVIIVCGCAIALLSFGPRSSFGFFMQPMSREFAWGRDVFGSGAGRAKSAVGSGPADRRRDRRPVRRAARDRVGALLYAAGLVLMRYAATPLSLDLGAGVLIGFGLSGCSFNLVLSAFGKLLPPERRGLALGAGTAAGSFGQFLFAPFGVAMIDNFGWQPTLLVFAALMLLIVPLSLALRDAAGRGVTKCPRRISRSFRTALAEAFGHRSYVLLVLGFFTCGFQLAFITVHLPAYLVDRGISGADRRLGDRGDRPVQHRRLAQRRLAAEHVSEALHPVDDLFHPGAGDRRLHLVADHAVLGDRCSARSAA